MAIKSKGEAPTPPSNKNDKKSALEELFGQVIKDTPSLAQGLNNLAMLPAFDPESAIPVPGTEFNTGVIAFNRNSRSISLACGKAMVRHIQLTPFIGMVENLHDDDTATVIIQNFQEQDGNQQGRGQTIGRINHIHSAVGIIQGAPGRAVKGPGDVAFQDYYYIDRSSLAAVYIAAKFQLLNQPILDSIQNTFDGWLAYSIPLNPLKPYDYKRRGSGSN